MAIQEVFELLEVGVDGEGQIFMDGTGHRCPLIFDTPEELAEEVCRRIKSGLEDHRQIHGG